MQIAVAGASSLSLRSIAKELNISAPAIYNYFSDRNALVTALTIDAFNSFADFQHAALARFPEAEHVVERLLATGRAYREWARTYPQRYVLIFGNPVPGYLPPMAELVPVMDRAKSALACVVGELYACGRLHVPDSLRHGSALPQLMAEGADSAHFPIAGISMLIWSRVHGLVSLELSNMLAPDQRLADFLYEVELQLIVSQFVNM